MDRLIPIVNRITAFGTFKSRESYLSFMFKIFLFIIPAIIISHFLDEIMNDVYKNCDTKTSKRMVLLFDIVIMISVFYIFFVFFQNYASEFQTTAAGGFFIALFFGFQPFFMDHLKDQMRIIFKGING